jgi:hypothetical protein
MNIHSKNKEIEPLKKIITITLKGVYKKEHVE